MIKEFPKGHTTKELFNIIDKHWNNPMADTPFECVQEILNRIIDKHHECQPKQMKIIRDHIKSNLSSDAYIYFLEQSLDFTVWFGLDNKTMD